MRPKQPTYFFKYSDLSNCILKLDSLNHRILILIGLGKYFSSDVRNIQYRRDMLNNIIYIMITNCVRTLL